MLCHLVSLGSLLPLFLQISQQASSYLGHATTLSAATASHLAQAYGDQAYKVLAIAGASPKAALAAPLVEGQPYIKAEVVYCCRYEYCARVEDFIARRTRLAFLDTEACAEAIPKVSEV
jgi:glycerol-3-phosphate dehydrogenase